MVSMPLPARPQDHAGADDGRRRGGQHPRPPVPAAGRWRQLPAVACCTARAASDALPNYWPRRSTPPAWRSSCWICLVAWRAEHGRGSSSDMPFVADVADSFAALRLLATHPRIDPKRIALMGFRVAAAPPTRQRDAHHRRATAARRAAVRRLYPHLRRRLRGFVSAWWSGRACLRQHRCCSSTEMPMTTPPSAPAWTMPTRSAGPARRCSSSPLPARGTVRRRRSTPPSDAQRGAHQAGLHGRDRYRYPDRP